MTRVINKKKKKTVRELMLLNVGKAGDFIHRNNKNYKLKQCRRFRCDCKMASELRAYGFYLKK